MNEPLPALRLVAGAFELYRRYPSLFFVLAAGVIVPYELIALVTTGTGPFSRGSVGLGALLLLELVDWVLIAPLVSALHVHAVAEVRRGREPRFGPVARQGLRVLPVVAAATIISGLGIALGFVALIVPGIILALRWVVVAQAAAIEHEGWLPALRRSRQLSAGHYGHIVAFLIAVGAIVTVPSLVGGIAFGRHDTSAVAFLTGLAVHVITASFGALASALLFFDLLERHETSVVPASTPPLSLDPRDYSDQDRPKGWYIDPDSPNQMRYWGGGDPLGWAGTIRAPRKIRRAWRAK
jgi:hypothetical protein